MGWLDKLLGRAKGATQRESGTGGGREAARPTEPARPPGESTRPSEPAGQEPRPGAGSEPGESGRM
jgi:hypothetical protein